MIIKILVSSQIHSLFILVTTLQRDLFTNIIFYHKNKINKYIYIYIYISYMIYIEIYLQIYYTELNWPLKQNWLVEMHYLVKTAVNRNKDQQWLVFFLLMEVLGLSS